MATIRITPELAELVRETCAACALTPSEVCQRTARSLERRPMSHNGENPNCVTRASSVRLRWRGELPEGVTAQQFRERLYVKCADTLAHMAHYVPFSTPLREGVDYTVREEE